MSENDRNRQDAESPAAAAAGPQDVGRLLCDQLAEAITAIRFPGGHPDRAEACRAGEGEGDEAVLTEPDDRAE
ncbi:hypothetical protein [Streptomyces sp. NPDC000229]|uniref:hypothetical protein n=1 Tax=Streptomyces sp. NPDC000229 TaxID=3154247 RepID=UPI00331CCD6F